MERGDSLADNSGGFENLYSATVLHSKAVATVSRGSHSIFILTGATRADARLPLPIVLSPALRAQGTAPVFGYAYAEAGAVGSL